LTVYYVGPGGNDANAGTSWALRRLTVDSGDSLLSAGDELVVGPGTYREKVTFNADGSSGNLITLTGDISGERTDGVGGAVRITGTDSSEAATRDGVIDFNGKSYHVIQGLVIGIATGAHVFANGSAAHNTIQDCWFEPGTQRAIGAAVLTDDAIGWLIRRNIIFCGGTDGIVFDGNGDVGTVDCGSVIESNLFFGGHDSALFINRHGGWIARNNTVIGGLRGLTAGNVPAGALAQSYYNNIIFGCFNGFEGSPVEDFNRVFGCQNSNITGSNSTTDPPWFLPWLLRGVGTPMRGFPFALAPYDISAHETADSATASSTSLYGGPVPQGLDYSIGAIQESMKIAREATTFEDGNYGYNLNGRGYHDFEVRALESEQVSISCQVKWDSNASIGSKPQIKLLAGCGISEQTDTATGDGTSSWEELTVTATPTATGILTFRVLNRSTHTASIKAYFDSIVVTRG